MTKQDKFQAMKAVYTYFFQESRKIMQQTAGLDSNLFLTSTPVKDAQKIIDGLGFRKRIIVPCTTSGDVDLDMLHEPVIERIVEIYEKVIPGLFGFQYRYFTPGSSQGIFHLLAESKARGTNKIHTFSGEYEGYREYGKTLGIETQEHDLNADLSELEKSVWFVSNPSAIDGNILRKGTIEALCNSGAEVNLDLAYAGSTQEQVFDVRNPNIKNVFLSFSKPYGVFRFRIGFAFSREPIVSLYANKWFKDIERVLASLKLAEEIGPNGLHTKYKPVQERIVQKLNRDFSLGITSSDVLLLGYLKDKDAQDLNAEQREMISSFRRADGYRFCLTPYFEQFEELRGPK